MRTLRPLLIPLVAPWCVCLAALGAVLTAFPGDAVQTFGEPQPGGLTVSLTAARPGSPPGRELTAMYADPPPAAPATAAGTLAGVLGGPPSFRPGGVTDATFFISTPPAESDGIVFADALEPGEVGDIVPASAEGLDFNFVVPDVSLHGSQAWGVQVMTSPATGSFYGATRGAAINLLWLAGVPLLWSAAWIAWRLRPTRRAAAA